MDNQKKTASEHVKSNLFSSIEANNTLLGVTDEDVTCHETFGSVSDNTVRINIYNRFTDTFHLEFNINFFHIIPTNSLKPTETKTIQIIVMMNMNSLMNM